MASFKEKRITIDSFDSDSVGNESEYLNGIIGKYEFVTFLRTDCPLSYRLRDLLNARNIENNEMYLDNHINGPRLQSKLSELTDGKQPPFVYVKHKYIGGYEEIAELIPTGLLADVINGVDLQKFEFDLVVIGGGCSGLSAALEATKYGKKVALCDSARPTAHGLTWGLGGSPGGSGNTSKDVFFRASRLPHDFTDAPFFGWTFEPPTSHNWATLATNLEAHLKSVSWIHRKCLREAGVQYVNGWARFKDSHTIEVTDSDNHVKKMTAKSFIVATGSKHRYLGIKGEEENSLSIEELLSLKTFEGNKSLIIGSDKDALEVAGILSGFNIETTVVIRRKLLSGIDAGMTDRIRTILEARGVKFEDNLTVVSLEKSGAGVKVKGVRVVPKSPSLSKLDFSQRKLSQLGSRRSPPPFDSEEADTKADPPAKAEGAQGDKSKTPDDTAKKPEAGSDTKIDPETPTSVTKSPDTAIPAEEGNSSEFDEDFTIVVVAAERQPNVSDLGLQNIKILCRKTCKIWVNSFDQTSIPNIFAIGQVTTSMNAGTEGVAKKAAQLLARRMFNRSNDTMEYNKVPKLILTPVEYAYIGASEDMAKLIHGKVTVYHNVTSVPRISLPNRFDNRSYVKVICTQPVPNIGSLVVGIHILAPNAGEILQGFVPSFTQGTLTKEQLNSMVGLCPTIADILSNLDIDKESGAEIGLNVL